jgi:hypothetical protein
MESFDGVGLHLVGQVILLIASVSPTKLAKEDSLLVEFVHLEPQ